MGSTITDNQAVSETGAPAIPAAVLGSVASRFRGDGLYLLMLQPDASVAWHDGDAGVFFHRYVLPLIQYPEMHGQDLRQHLHRLAGSSPMVLDNLFPGVVLAVFPYVEKRHLAGVLVLAARSGRFELTEDVLRVCGRLALDATWLGQQARQLPAHAPDGLQRQARMLNFVVRDQVRLGGLGQELDSLSGQLANTYEELSLIYQVSSGMKINRRASDFFEQVCLDVLEVLTVRGMGVALQADSSQHQEPVLYGDLSLPPGKVHRLADELMVLLCQKKSPLLVNDLTTHKSFQWLAEHASRLLAVPLQRQDQVLGCLFALDKSPGDFDSVDAKLLNSIANESAIYLENAMLYEDVHGLMMGLLHSLTSAVDAKDAYTCGHSERVALFARYLAQQAGLSDYDVERVYMGGLLHDVGKIGVPETVLQKAGRLTPEEFELIKKHPQIGARILRDVKQVQDIVPGVLHHHERYDGKGYPAGLAGEQIPLMGRIICLADCFDAMTSNRTYRKALPLEVALTEIRRCAGTQFDPALAEAFLHLNQDRFRQLLREYQDESRPLMELQESLRSAMAVPPTSSRTSDAAGN